VIEQSCVSIEQSTVWPIIVLMNIRIDRSGITIPGRPKDIIFLHWIRKGDYRALWTAPVIVHCINVLNIMAIRVYIDQVIARIVLENVVMHFYARRSASLYHFDAIYIILKDIIIIGDGVIAGYCLLK